MVSVWLVPPLGLSAALAVVFVLVSARANQYGWQPILATATCGWVFAAGSLALAVATEWTRLHVLASIMLAMAGGLCLAVWPGPPSAVVALAAASFVPVAVYVAFLPTAVVAYVIALRLTRTVDPRARIVLDLLTSAKLTASGTAWLRRTDSRDRLASVLERVARTAERDIPRLVARQAADPSTREWLASRGRAMAGRVREVKQRLLLSSPSAGEELRAEIAGLLLLACRGDWDEIGGDREVPPAPGLLRTVLDNIKLSLALLAGAALVHWVLAPSLGSRLLNVRDALIVIAALALIPLPRGELRRVSDTFGELARP